MDFTVLNSQQKTQWTKFTNGMNELNRRFAKTRFDLWVIQKAIETYRNYDGSYPPSFSANDVTTWQGIATTWLQGVTQLNNAYALTQSGSAYVSPSKTAPGDLDIVVEADTLPESVVTNATYNTDLPDGTLGLWPLVIGGAIVITALVLVSGIVGKVTDAIVRHKRLDANVEKIKADVEKDMKSANPEIYKLWADLKEKQIQPAEKSFMDQLKEGASGFVLVALAAFALFAAWKMFGGKKQ